MRPDAVVVNLVGLGLIAGIMSYFRPRSRRVQAELSGGVQSVLIVVKGGYTPDTVVVERGRPVRLLFRREETALCSERVVLPAFGRSARLPEGEEVAVEFVPTERGEFPFACQMGMLRGRVVVE